MTDSFNSAKISAVANTADESMSLAGFWQRTLALIIDATLVGFIESILTLAIFVMPLMFAFMHIGPGAGAEKSQATMIYYTICEIVNFLVIFAMLAVAGAYSVIFESSRLQATPGKLALGLVVTDLRGERISWQRGTLKVVAQYLLYGLIFAVSLICDAGIIAIALAAKPEHGAVPQFLPLALANVACLVPILVGNLLYLCCFVLLVYSDRKQTVFDKLTGRLVWTIRRTIPGSGNAQVLAANKAHIIPPSKARDVALVAAGTLIVMSGTTWLLEAINSVTHSSFSYSYFAIPIIVASFAFLAVLFVVQILLTIALMNFDGEGVIRYLRLRAFMLVGTRRKLWYDFASAVSQYVQGDCKSAEEVLRRWDGILSGQDVDSLLRIRLFGCVAANDSDGVIDVGQKMSERPVYQPLDKLMVTAALFRKEKYKEGLALLESFTAKQRINATTLNIYFASYYSRLGCERELNASLAWLEKSKFPLTNHWKLHLQGNCAAAKGNIDRARASLKQALNEVSQGNGSGKPQALITSMFLRGIKNDLAKLDNGTVADPDHLSAFRPQLKQIAKRLSAAEEVSPDKA